MGSLRGLAARILPPPGVQRSLAVQSAVFAVGSGTFLTGSVVFFTHVVGLSPIQIGLGFSLVGLVGLIGSLPAGHLADRIGGRRAWVIAAVAEGVCYFCYPAVQGFWSFLVVLVMIAVAQLVGNSGRTVYTGAVIPPEERVRAMGFMRAYLNVGFTIGAGLGAIALAFNSRAGLIALVLVNAVGMMVNAVTVARMPAATVPRTSRHQASPWGVLRDHPYTALASIVAVMWFHGIIFTETLPLWTITRTDAPKPVLGALFALNTVMAVLLQVPATRGADSISGSVRLMRRAAWSTALACPAIAASGMTHGWLTIAALALAVILTTATELWSSAAQWYFQMEIPPADQRGAYSGANGTITGISRMIAPAALTYLGIQTGGWGWWLVAGIFVVLSATVGPVVAWVQRTARNGVDLAAAEPAPAVG
jgi:Major Facilitator Superfamily